MNQRCVRQLLQNALIVRDLGIELLDLQLVDPQLLVHFFELLECVGLQAVAPRHLAVHLVDEVLELLVAFCLEIVLHFTVVLQYFHTVNLDFILEVSELPA